MLPEGRSPPTSWAHALCSPGPFLKDGSFCPLAEAAFSTPSPPSYASAPGGSKPRQRPSPLARRPLSLPALERIPGRATARSPGSAAARTPAGTSAARPASAAPAPCSSSRPKAAARRPSRGCRRTAQAPPRAAGLLGVQRPPVQVLHAGHDPGPRPRSSSAIRGAYAGGDRRGPLRQSLPLQGLLAHHRRRGARRERPGRAGREEVMAAARTATKKRSGRPTAGVPSSGWRIRASSRGSAPTSMISSSPGCSTGPWYAARWRTLA